ncbi:Biotin synthesis protein bioC [Methylophaga frappieri]|uniref:Malonyl-[acyl-carrier protein] O-methyltransferase n=1 Tax=Methylophaga frappieri (strain ATCC BAA-2434 / DSM 25690 / JAM7) TaxID=754477 RepID=I1YHS1_METFJ|nr:malonyl-ACP O-methyltransferase BioC [Methylophaga frappieri]AFJ02464.1 Biotin synthesis protein bioC [Methylophaga frappieri]
MTEPRPDKKRVAQSFSAAARSYDDVAVLQRQTADELLDRLGLLRIQPQQIIDLGAGTGRNLPLLKKRYPKADLLAVDIAPQMLVQAQQRMQTGWRRFVPDKRLAYLVADAESLPLKANSVDLIFANLSFQWCDLTKVFAECQRLLRPEGVLMFTTLGPDTLIELRQSWAAVDALPHVNQFLDMHDVAQAMQDSGLQDAVLDVDRHQLGYPDARKMMRDLKLLGARNQLPGRRRGLTGRHRLQAMLAASEQFRLADGQLPATYEVIYGHAFSVDRYQSVAADGSVHVSLAQLKGRL